MRKTAALPGIAGNDLNRCGVPALQHKIRANSKRTAVFFANSRLRGVEMGGGGWKRIALDSNKERLVRSCHLCALIRGLQNLESSLLKRI